MSNPVPLFRKPGQLNTREYYEQFPLFAQGKRGRGAAGGFVPADIPQAEADALILLYNNTTGASWTDDTNWLSDTTVGNWFGITVVGGHVTGIDLDSNNLNGDIGAFVLTSFPGLIVFSATVNESLIGSIASWTFPSAFKTLDIRNTGVSGDISSWSLSSPLEKVGLYSCDNITGDLSSWIFPSTIRELALNNTGVSGDFSSWSLPAGFRSLNLAYGSGTITDVPDVSGVTSLQAYSFSNLALSQTIIDRVLLEIYTARANYTHSTPTLDMAGNNAAPSGIYQDGDPPTTGKEYIYELENDPESEGFYVWVIGYTV